MTALNAAGQEHDIYILEDQIKKSEISQLELMLSEYRLVTELSEN